MAIVPLIQTILAQDYWWYPDNGTQEDLSLSFLGKHISPPAPIYVRPPPTYDILYPWTPTPPGWFLGTWYFTHSSQVVYQEFRNMQWTLTPEANTSYLYPYVPVLNDLTSHQVLNGSGDTIFFEYGLDYLVTANGSTAHDAYAYFPTGLLSSENNTWEVISWGYDLDGVPFAVMFETESLHEGSTSLDIIARGISGPNPITLSWILAAVKALGNPLLAPLVDNVKKLVQDGGRNGQPWPICNATCMTNAYAYGVANL